MVERRIRNAQVVGSIPILGSIHQDIERESMATTIRLQRVGSNKRPRYRVIVIDKSRANTGGLIENLGDYDAMSKDLKHGIKEPRVLSWLAMGAMPSDSAKSLFKRAGIWTKWVINKAAHQAETKAKAAARPKKAAKPKAAK